MNVKFEHRTGDLAVTGVFTWAKSMDDKSAAAGVGATGEGFQGTTDNHHPELDYGPSDFNVDHRFVASYVYQLPIGRGKKLLGGVGRAAQPAGGRLGGDRHHHVPDRVPLSVYANDLGSVLQAVPQRADVVSGCDIHGGTLGSVPASEPGLLHSAPLSVCSAIPAETSCASPVSTTGIWVSERLPITERFRFGLHVDTFNTFNHHQYAGDVGGLVLAGSGGNVAISRSVGACRLRTNYPGVFIACPSTQWEIDLLRDGFTLYGLLCHALRGVADFFGQGCFPSGRLP